MAITVESLWASLHQAANATSPLRAIHKLQNAKEWIVLRTQTGEAIGQYKKQGYVTVLDDEIVGWKRSQISQIFESPCFFGDPNLVIRRQLFQRSRSTQWEPKSSPACMQDLHPQADLYINVFFLSEDTTLSLSQNRTNVLYYYTFFYNTLQGIFQTSIGDIERFCQSIQNF